MFFPVFLGVFPWRVRGAAEPLDGEEYLDISGIMRNQAGRYECKASNDVATPDVKYVNVVVNCECCPGGVHARIVVESIVLSPTVKCGRGDILILTSL